ncbi:major tail protein [Halobacillus karajensis]|uniref:major tail protein n=1 Tax=Halobacillus karajensis TaxID=195088 RepID=UPI00045C78ED|nr:major tail protein [Halobacillus karajensis]CDQ17943.1 phage major tail protein, phi13 family [Halobacillus karajensis]
MPQENFKASTGVERFYYAPLDETETAITTSDPERVKFLQNVTVEMPQEAVRAYGDNTTAEIAVSNGNITVNGAFHTLPYFVKEVLLGLEKDENGLVAHGSSDNPPYVACVFAKTFEDGSTEWVGLTKGMFMRPNISGQTKQDSTQFSSEEISGAFMDREVNGFDDEKSVVFGRDAKGETTQRDALFQAVFGRPYPTTTTTTTTTSA